jgi:heme A synthase
MTSGQGENQPGGPYGPPPQGWNAPPPPAPGYQYPGYAPTPSAPVGYGPGVPQAMERPTSVRAGLGAFIGSMVLTAVAQVVTLLNWQTVLDWTLADAGLEQGADAELTRQTAEAGALIGIVVGFVFFAVYGLFVWFAWRGYNWARIVLWVLAGLGILSGLAGLAFGSPLPFLSALNVFQLLLLVAAVVFLALKPSSEWYRFRGWQRATGQG